eukprot:3499237-Rhodomonas_salina.1
MPVPRTAYRLPAELRSRAPAQSEIKCKQPRAWYKAHETRAALRLIAPGRSCGGRPRGERA